MYDKASIHGTLGLANRGVLILGLMYCVKL